MHSVGSPLAWTVFFALIVAMLAIDLGVFHRKVHAVSFREAAVWSVVWVALSLLFNLGVYFAYGADRALEFTTGYLLEKALSVDNLFVFVLVFQAFAIPAQLQHRVLFWGILGALLMRGAFIVAGGALVQRFHFILYGFGALLVITGAKLMFHKEGETHPENNPVVRAFRRFLPTTDQLHGEHFWIREGGKRLATPLLITLITMEVTDLVFAVDSIPAIFAITQDPFIVFTSNILAILGLRSLYFLLAGMMDRFSYLKIGLALILVFVGVKMLIMDLFKIPIVLSLGVIAAILATSVIASLARTQPTPTEPTGKP